MEDKQFSDYFEWIRYMVERHREQGADNNKIRCMIIGMITADAGEENEKVFTESQLKKIFDLSFTKKIGLVLREPVQQRQCCVN